MRNLFFIAAMMLSYTTHASEISLNCENMQGEDKVTVQIQRNIIFSDHIYINESKYTMDFPWDGDSKKLEHVDGRRIKIRNMSWGKEPPHPILTELNKPKPVPPEENILFGGTPHTEGPLGEVSNKTEFIALKDMDTSIFGRSDTDGRFVYIQADLFEEGKSGYMVSQLVSESHILYSQRRVFTSVFMCTRNE